MLSTRPHAELTDLELLEQYKLSEEVNWAGILYNRYTAMVYGVCLKYLKDREDAKDAAMQLFEKLVNTLKEHEIEHFKSWLYVTTRNYCLMQLRSKKGKYTEEISPLLMETSTETHLEEQNVLESNLSKLEKCIEKLAHEQKACVRMFFLQEKCYNDITVLTGYEINKVKSFIQNGKRNLKICMEQHD